MVMAKKAEYPAGTSALVVEGGAMRGIFAAGVLDGFMEKGFNPFGFCIGVSAGATNLAAWLCGQKERNLKVFTDYSCRPEFISFFRLFTGGHVLDLDWLWDITIREIRLDLDHFYRQDTDLYIVTTNALTGDALYIRAEAESLEPHLKASSALPVFYRGFPCFDGLPMTDGGVSDSIPVIKAYEMGAREITVILSRPPGYRKKEKKNLLSGLMLKGHPAVRDAMDKRGRIYNRAVDFMESPPSDCRINLISPPADFSVGRTTRDRNALMAGYRMGLDAADLYLSSSS